MSGKKASGVSERHLLPLGLCWRVILNQSQPFKWSLLAKSRYVAGGEDLPTGLAGFGQVFVFFYNLFNCIAFVVFPLHKKKLMACISGRVLSLRVLQDEY